jgi:hypothetical protein
MDLQVIMQLIDDYLDGTANEAAVAQLKVWLEADAANLEVFAREVFFHQQLRETLLAENSARFMEAASNPEAMNPDAMNPEAANSEASNAGSKPVGFPQGLGMGNIPWPRSPLMLLLLFMLTIASASYFAFRLGRKDSFLNQPVAERVAGSATEAAPYVAKLVKVTNCLWDSTRSTADLKRDSEISSGQSLYLLEGVAEIHSLLSDGTAGKFILEGPVNLMMTSHGVPSLQYGKLSVTINGDSDCFALDTSLGCFIASHDASFGIMSNANKVELHVFSGSVTFEPQQLFSAGDDDEPLKAAAGTSLLLSLSPERAITVRKGAAQEESFITQDSLNASHLNISEGYVAAIKQAKPIAYWRFDRLQDNVVPNEMGSQFACQVKGPVGWRTYPSGNRTAEFGMSTQPGLLLSDDALSDELKYHYSIEFWIKPSYCQLGSVFSLVKCNPDNSVVPVHGVLVELVGPASDQGTSPSQVDRIRFLHRSPPSMAPRSGTSCYSNHPYTPRVWQHVAAVKDGPKMKLFLDGKLVAESRDITDTPDGLRVLMGQLYSFSTGPNAAIRPFVGELAEVAMYDRSLTQAEINKHIALARTESADGNTW